MRIHVFAANALVLVAIASSSLLRAQFQQPTAEELKMTADPKAPGAAAVYLNIEEITDDEHHYSSTYARDHDAPDDVVSALKGMPDSEFDSMAGVWHAVGRK
jgi:hypothetical protein